jgi:DNA-binding beta-propeller fold protein YncE
MHPRLFRVGVGVITASLLALGGVTSIAPTSAGAAGPYTAYVGNDQCPTNDSVTAISGPSSWTVGATIGVGNCPAGIAFSPDGSTAYMANAADNTITPINTSTFTAGTAFSSGVTSPLYMAVTPNGASLVVGGPGSNQVAVISTANTASVQTVSVGNSPGGVAILPDSSAAYIDNGSDNTVDVVSLTGTPAVTKTITFPAPGCTGPEGNAVTANGKWVWVACGGNGMLWGIKVSKEKAKIAIKVGKGDHQVVVTPNGLTGYVSSPNNNKVFPVNLTTHVVGNGIAVNDAYGLAISPDGNYVIAGDGTCCFATTNVYVIKTSNNTITATLNTGGFTHRWLAFQP